MRCGNLAGKVVLLISTVLSLFHSCHGLNSEGTSFVLAFLDSEVENWQDIPLEVWVINSGPTSAVVSISAPRDNNLVRPSCTGAKTVQIPAGQQHMFALCWWAKIMPTDKSVNDKAIRIDSNVDVSVIAVNKEAFSGDSYQILPISSLGTAYYTIVAGAAVSLPNTFAVIATEDDTSVTISLPVHAEGAQLSFVHKCMVYEGGATFTIKLHAHQVFSVMDVADITGTKIVASRPVAVFNGNTRMHIPATDKSRDHMCEQALSIGNWDNEYAHIPIGPNSVDFIRFLADEDHVDIIWSAANGTTNMIMLNKGEFMDYTPFGFTHFTSASAKKYSAVLMTSSVRGPSGVERDPVMLNMQGLNQWANSYTMPAFHSAQSTLNGGLPAPYAQNSFYILAAAASLSGLRLDGEVLPVEAMDTCQSVPNSGMSCRIDVNGSTSHVLNHVSGHLFGAFMFSTDDRESLSSTLALNGPVRCEPAVMTRGDGLDNDCDGNVDEETCDGIDNDNDGLLDEDCTSSSGQARGRAYLIVFPDNSKSDPNPADLNKLALYISPQNTLQNTSVTVSSPLTGYTETMIAPALSTTEVNINVTFRLPQGSGRYNQSLLIESSDDIVIYAMNQIKFSSESFLALPIDSIGYDYYVATITVSDSNDVAELAACASDAGTTDLEITLADIAGVNVIYDGSSYGAGEVITTSLEQYQCLQLQSGEDLTGTRVLSTNENRISVFSGNRRPIIGPGNARDHIVEQLNPVPTWGREFHTIPIKRDGTRGDERGDIVRIIASEDNTVISLSSTGPAFVDSPVIALKGQFREINVGGTEYTFISASKPVLVVQYSKTQLNKDQTIDKGDPSMTLVIPKQAWANDYRFVTPRSGQKVPNTVDEYLPYTSKMNIAIEKQFISQLRYGTSSGLFSTSFPSANWVDVPGTNPVVSATTVDVAFGQNYVTAAGGNVFSAVVYGAADREFYANPISLQLLSTQCVVTAQSESDGVDNDCDGVVDEEVCNGLDDDNDGLVDEDCTTPPDGSQGSYLFVFMENSVEYPILNPLNIMATPRCAGTTIVRMRTPNVHKDMACDINMPLTEGGMQRFGLPEWYKPVGSAMSNKSILIESSCAISVAGYNMDKFSNDAFFVLPSTLLGREYRAMSYYPVTLGSELSVIATDFTNVMVTLPNHGAASPSIRHPITNVTYGAGESFVTTIAQYESMQLVADNGGDLSGTIISSPDTNLAVFSGNIRVGIDSNSRDHLVEQLAPWSRASNDWVVVTNSMTSTEIVKFTCDPGVTISFPGQPDVTFSTSGQVEQMELPRFYAERVTATGNCQLVLITISQSSKTAPLQGDPTMSIIIPTSQHISSANFAIPTKPWRKRYGGEVDEYEVHLVVVARTSQLNAIKLDGEAVLGWSTVDGTYAATRVQLTRKNVGETYSLRSDNGELFDARLWGVADRESFAYPLGMQ